MRFKDKVLFVTGGASGLARATALQFAAEGGKVAVVDLNGEKAAAVAAELPDAIGLACDVSNEDAVRAAVAATIAKFGRIDCIYAAGGHADFGPIEEWDLARFNKMLGVHIGGTFLVCKHAVPHMKKLGKGAIVTTASVAGYTAQPFNAAYGAAKAGIAGYTRQLALELAPHGIRVNAVAPGRVLSGMTAPLYTSRGGGDIERGKEQAGANNMLKRVGVAEEIAMPVCFMLSDEASFYTGQVMVVDGGETSL